MLFCLILTFKHVKCTHGWNSYQFHQILYHFNHKYKQNNIKNKNVFDTTFELKTPTLVDQFLLIFNIGGSKFIKI